MANVSKFHAAEIARQKRWRRGLIADLGPALAWIVREMYAVHPLGLSVVLLGLRRCGATPETMQGVTLLWEQLQSKGPLAPSPAPTEGGAA